MADFSMDEAADAIDDSEDEADYTKMDMGNKKGPVNRWDFENNEQYQDYMSKREAMPKYVFSYQAAFKFNRIVCGISISGQIGFFAFRYV